MQKVNVIVSMPSVLSLGMTSVVLTTHKQNNNLQGSPLHLKADGTLVAVADRS